MLSDLPEEWKILTLEEVAEIDWGDTKVTKKSYCHNGFTAFSAAGADGKLPYFDFERRGFVVSAIGANSGKVFWANGKWSAIKNTMVVFPLPKISCAKFLYYAAQKKGFWNISGGAQPFINLGNAKKQKLLCPPFNEQERIAEILNSVDESISATERVIAQAERVKRGLMEELLTGGLGSRAIERGEVPEGWEKKPIYQLVNVVTGKTPSTKKINYWDGDIPFFTPADLDTSYKVSQAARSVTNIALNEGAKLIPKNSILYTCIGSTLGKLSIVEVDCVTNQQINACITNVNTNTYFIYYSLLFNENKIKSKASCTAVPIINKTVFSSIELLIPNILTQKKSAEILTSIDETISANESVMAQLKRIKTGLMQDLLSGKVRVLQ